QHTNFKLSVSGEEIGLFTNDGKLIDSIRYAEQISDISFGRYPDGAENWFFFDQPTPGTSNINSGFSEIIQNPEFSLNGGFYQDSISIELIKDTPNETIRYTLDGSLPNLQSSIYSAAIVLTSTTVIRAQSFRESYLSSKVITHTYFINETTTLPVVSVATDPDNLWDDEIGIYVEGTNGIPGFCVSEPRNWNQPWERPISLEMYETSGNLGFKIDAGMQIGGGCTRKYPQKTLAVYVRSKYGVSKINYRIFDDKQIDSYNNIILRNSGQDWWRAMFRDGMMQTLVKDRMDIDWQAYKPAILFLNGEYWGIHAIREKHNEHYLESNYGIDPDKIDILRGNAEVKQGSSELYEGMIDFIKTHDMAVTEHYNWVTTQMDINEYLNYMIAEIYFANIDWPSGNIKYWRQHGENNKWRWILFDTDLGFGAHGLGQYDSNTLANATASTSTYYANPPWSTLLLRKLLENTEFKNQFIQRFASRLNITFTPQRVLYIIDSLKTNIEPEIPRHIQKWEQSTSFNDGWNYHIEVMREFASLRPRYVFDHLIEKFGLSGSTQLNVNYDNPEMGNVFINGVKLPGNNFSGKYLKDIPIQCKAIPKHGYRFVGWQEISNSLSDTVNLVLTTESSLKAIFEVDDSEVFYGLRINEILTLNDQTYSDENGEYDDWVELFNDSPEAIDIGGVYVTDDLNQPEMWQIPASSPDSTTIQPGGFLLLWADKDPEQGILHLNLKLSGNGEELGLARKADSGFVFIDTIVFGSQTADVSYGRFPDGGDDFTFFLVPSPGYQNIPTGITEDNIKLPPNTFLNQNYPNPFNSSTLISYSLKVASKVKLTIYDVTGRELKTVLNKRQFAGEHSVAFNAADLPSGIYIYHLKIGAFERSRKMLLLR
ncbi:MAG: CotH kinase family protein, partial [Desulfobacterales bacterium]|nr:CotH kinase family protein [Desulfobacterales bacterium]